MSGISRKSICGGSVSAYADDITIIMIETGHLQRVDKAIKVYKTMSGAKINLEKSVGLQLDTWKSKSMLSDSVVVRLIEGTIKFLGVWFGLDLLIEKDCASWYVLWRARLSS